MAEQNPFEQFVAPKEENPFEQFLKPEQDPGYLGETVRALKHGAQVTLPKAAGNALKFFGAEDTGQSIVEGAEQRDTPDLQESTVGKNARDDRWWGLRGNVASAADNAVMSLAPGAAGAAIGAGLTAWAGPGAAVGALAGYAIGSLASLPIFYGSQAQESYEAVKKHQLELGTPEAEADRIARLTGHGEGAIEAGGELVQDIIPFAKLFKPFGKVAGKAVVSSVLKPTLSGAAKTVGEVVGGEVATEMAQQAGEDWTRKAVGDTGEGATWDETKKVIVPTALMSIFPGGAGAGAHHYKRTVALNALTSPETDPDLRANIAVSAAAAMADGNEDVARAFSKYAADQIEKKAPIEISDDDQFYLQYKLAAATSGDEAIAAADAALSAPIDLFEQSINAFKGEWAAERTPADSALPLVGMPEAAPVVQPAAPTDVQPIAVPDRPVGPALIALAEQLSIMPAGEQTKALMRLDSDMRQRVVQTMRAMDPTVPSGLIVPDAGMPAGQGEAARLVNEATTAASSVQPTSDAVVGNVPAYTQRAAQEIVSKDPSQEMRPHREVANRFEVVPVMSARGTGRAVPATLPAPLTQQQLAEQETPQVPAAPAVRPVMPAAPLTAEQTAANQAAADAERSSQPRHMFRDSQLRSETGPDIKGEKVTRNMRKVLAQMGRIVGTKVVFEFAPGESDGAVPNREENTIHINTAAQINPMQVMGHEVTHVLRSRHAAAWGKIRDALVATMPDKRAALDAFAADYWGVGDANAGKLAAARAIPDWSQALTPEQKQQFGTSENTVEAFLLDEMVSDLGGQHWSDEKFWLDVFAKIEKAEGAKSRGIIERLVIALRETLAKFLAVVRAQKQGDYATVSVEQIEATRDAISSAYAQFIRAERGTEPSGEPHVTDHRISTSDTHSRSQGDGEVAPPVSERKAAPETGDELGDARAAELARLSTQRVEIADDDGSGVPNARLAEFDDDAYIQFAQTKKNSIALLSMASSGKHRGRDMLKWLGDKFGLPIHVYEVAPDAIGFWNKMEDEGAIRGWTADRFSGKTVSSAPARPNQRLFFEVAPNPNDAAAVSAWNKRTDAQKRKVSEAVVSRIIPGLLADLQVTGKVVTQLGGWMDDTNPSFALVVSRGDPALAARAIGYVLDQEAVYALGLKSFTGAEKTGIIHIDIAGKDAHQIYMQVRALDREVISGHSTIGNEMLIGLPIDRMNELEKDIDAIAKKEGIAIRLDEGYGATIKDYGYDIQLRTGNTSKQHPAARDIDQWRTEARAATGPDAAGRGSDREGAVFSSDRPSYGTVRAGTGVSAVGVHYSQAQRETLSSRFFGTGMKGEERARIMHSNDERIKRRLYFYTNEGAGIAPESGVGSHAHSVTLNNLYDIDADQDGLVRRADPTKDWRDQPIAPSLLMNHTEAAIIDAGYDGYVTHEFGSGGAIVLLGDHSVPVQYDGLGARPDVPVAERAAPSPRRAAADRIAADRTLPSGRMTGAEWKRLVPEATHLADDKSYYKSALAGARMSESRPPSWYYSPLTRAAESAQMKQAPASGWRTWLKSLAAKGVKPDEIKWSGIEEWLDAQGEARVTREQVQAYLSEFGVKVETILRGERNPIRPETVTQEDEDADYDIELNIGEWETDEPDESWLSERASEVLEETIDERVEDTWGDIYDDIQREARTQIEVMLPDLTADIRREMGDMFPVDDALVEQVARNYAAAQVVGDTWEEYAIGDLNDDTVMEAAVDRAFAVLSGDLDALDTEARRRARADIDEDKLLDELTDRERTWYYDDYDSPQTQRITVDGVDGDFYHTYAYGDRQLYHNGRNIDLPRRADEADVEGAIRTYVMEEGLVSGGRGSSESFRPTKWADPRYSTDMQRAVAGSYREVQLTLPVGAFGLPKTRAYAPELGSEFRYYDKNGDLIGATTDEAVAKLQSKVNDGRYEDMTGRVETERVSAKDFYYTTHWSEADVIGHARFDEHRDADGKRVLVLQEVQGDWGQQRRDGLEAREKHEAALVAADAANDRVIAATMKLKELDSDTEGWNASDWYIVKSQDNAYNPSTEAQAAAYRELRAAYDEWRDFDNTANRTQPNDLPSPAPFIEKTVQWAGLVLKRMIAHAVDYGFDKVVWTSGAQQVERWRSSLRQQVDTIAWEKTEDGIHIVASQNGRQRTDTRVSETALSDAIGKQMAKQIIADPNQRGEITGDDITISDTGMAGFYDRMLPNIANDILKKFDKTIRVQDIEVHPAVTYRVKDLSAHGGAGFAIVDANDKFVSSPAYDASQKYAAEVRAETLNTAHAATAITTQQGFEITDKLRESAANGMPLFSQRRASADARKSEARKEWYRSQLSDAVGGLPAKIRTGKEAALWLTSNAAKLGVKKDELQWSGVTDWLATQRNVTGAQIQDWLGSNGVRVKTVVLGEESPEYKRLDDEWSAIDQKVERLKGEAFGPQWPKRMARLADTPSRELARGNTELREALINKKYSVEEIDAIVAYGRALNRKNELFEQRKAAMGKPVKFDRDGLVLPGGSKYRELLLVLPADKAVAYNKDNIVPIYEGEYVTDKNRFWYFKAPDNVYQIPKNRQPVEADAQLYIINNKQPASLARFTSSHYPQPNILAHVRFDERTDADGKRVLFVQEVQSDWAQKGRKEGFNTPLRTEGWTAIKGEGDPASGPVWEVRNAQGRWVLGVSMSNASTAAQAISHAARTGEQQRGGGQSQVPSAPFVTDTKAWVALALKRMIAHAVDNGFDRVAWTTGEQQAERYDLSKQLDRLDYQFNTDGDRRYVSVRAFAKGSGIALDDVYAIDKSNNPSKRELLEDAIGKDVAKKIADDAGTAYPDGSVSAGWKKLTGLDLKVGGEGMVAFYDGIVKQVARSLGATMRTVQLAERDPGTTVVGDAELDAEIDRIADEAFGNEAMPIRKPGIKLTTQQPGFDITDKMREQAAVGMPLFSERRSNVTDLITKPTRDFHKSLTARIQERADETQRKADEYDGWQWDVGDRIRSNKTGKVYSITGRTWDKTHGAMYLYETADKDNAKEWEAGRLIAEKAHGTMELMGVRRSTARRDLTKGKLDTRRKEITILQGTRMYHGAHDAPAAEIERSGSLLARPSDKSGGGLLTEGGMIWFGWKELAQGHAKGEVDMLAASLRDNNGDGKVFDVVTDRDYRLANMNGYTVNEDEANKLTEALGYDGEWNRVKAGQQLSSVVYRAFEASPVAERYQTKRGEMRVIWPIVLKTLGFDGMYDSSGVALFADNGITLGDPMRRFSTARPANLDRWLGKSVVRTVMYHGTARDITTFRPQQADAIFLTDDPKFAGEFADLSHSWLLNNYWMWMSPEQIQQAKRDAMRMLLQDALPGSSLYMREERLLNQSQQPSQYMRRAVEQYMPSDSNVMPLYVRAENPFDYRNPEHVAAIEAELGPSWMGQESIGGETRDVAQHIGDLERGDWNAIESPQVQAYIRAHHDSFYVRERGVTNLAVFSPNQVKSASGNDGAYSRKDNDIRRSEMRKFSPTLEAEIEERMRTANEDEDTDAHMTRADVIHEFMQDSDDKDHYSHQFQKELRQYGIEQGIYREVTPAQLARTVTLGGKKYDFKLNGKTYVFDSWDGQSRESTPRSRITGQPINQSWTDPDITDWDDMVRKMQDDKIDTKRVLRAIRDAGIAVAERFDTYMLEINYHGRAAARVKAFADGELRHLLEDMAMRGVAMQDLDDYLWARHAPERNAANAKTNPAITDGSGMSDAQSAAILAGQAVTIGTRTIQLTAKALRGAAAVSGRVDAITKGTLDLLVSSGLETQQTVSTWRKTYSSYAPLKRDMESDANYSGAFGLGNGTGTGFSVRGAASRRALGSKRAVTDVLANIAMQRERAITRSEKNRVSQAIYGLALTAPNPEFWIPVNTELNKRLSPAALQKVITELVSIGVNPIDAQNIATEPVKRYIDSKTGLEMQRIDPSLRGREDVLSTRINGEDRYVFFSNKKRAQAMVHGLKNLDAATVSGALQVIAPVTRWFASINTQYNPVFGLTNGVRDFSTGMLNLSSTPLAAHRADVARNAFSALKGVYLDLRDHRAGKQPTSQWAQLFEQFALDGGQTGYRDMFATSTERADAIADELKHAGKGQSWLAVGEKRSHIFGWLSDYNTAVENAMRLSSYKVALDNGMSRDAAASLAKNLTVNFNKKGLAATQTGALYAFFNASVQGTARMAETMTTDGKLNKIGQKIVYGGMMLGVLQAVMGMLAGWDDDEPPQFSREKNFIIPIPGSDKYVSLPMPLGFHVIPNLGRITTEWLLSGGRDPGKRLTRMAGVILDSFNPIGSGTLAQTLSPTIGDPIIALGENKDWTGKSIYKEDFNKMHPTPGWTRTKDSASPPSRWLSYGINYITGGGKYGIGMASPTPDQLDYLVGQATGGTGRELLKTAQYLNAKATGEDLPIYKTPLGVGRFVGETKGQSSEISQFYRNLERIGEHKSALDEMKHDGNGAAMRDYLSANPDARLIQMADKAQREIGYLRRQKREMIEKDVGRERIKLLEDRITATTRRYNEMMRAR